MYNRFISEQPRAARGLKMPSFSLGGIREMIDGILPFGLDTGDLLLLLVLFFLYSESGDEEFLILLAVIGYQIFFKRD